jgi:hypothetical protein
MKKIIFLLLTCFACSHNLVAQKISSEEKALQKTGAYFLHGITFHAGMTLLRQQTSAFKKLITLPIALAFITTGSKPFVPGNTYFDDIEAGKRPDPFSLHGFLQECSQTYEATKKGLIHIYHIIETELQKPKQ